MPVVLIELDKRDVLERYRAGDVAAFTELWADHPDAACLICDAPAGTAPLTMVLPDKPPNRGRVVAAPLCPACTALPPMVRFNRCLKLLRAMWSRPGKQVHFR